MSGAGTTTVLGVDLALRSWEQIGAALLSFICGPGATWTACQTDAIGWPTGAVTASAVASAIMRAAAATGASAIAIDGPHAWRDPCDPRPGATRLAEQQLRAPGKTGSYGRAVPRTYTRWTAFSIAIFQELLALPRVRLANDPAMLRHPPAAGHCYLLETFPTATWRASALAPLPGHRAAPPAVVWRSAEQLRRCYGLPVTALTDHHDHLQAIVAALSAAGLLGGPCRAIAHGVPARELPASEVAPAHLVEGLIWVAAPLATAIEQSRMSGDC